MALHFVLMVNNHAIGQFTAVRQSGNDDPRTRNLYEVTVRDGDGLWQGHVTHIYGDGAWVLVRRTLQLRERQLESQRQKEVKRE